ncbi:MAG: SPFH domain-containing protein [Candidatus Heimdallarchaeota archaeon]|nr:SPFH domain-containing protein [Candidatus Heimdallarchaeota archaeon]MDH5644692.1 SPFH domain-containing protein [Candidatus Heimdallarchaeota archaeon]
MAQLDVTTIGFLFTGIIVAIGYILYTTYNVVKPDEVHVISGRGKIKMFNGGQSYRYFPLIHKKNIISTSVIEIAVQRIKLLDSSNLPFAVEISCKVQVSDAKTAVQTLGKATANEIKPIVDDTIQAAARSEAMRLELTTIMRERDEIETAIYKSTAESLSRLGVKVLIFDIRDIVDVPGSTVISDMERVKSAELTKLARIAEAEQSTQAEIIEAQKISEAEVQKQQALQKSEAARLEQEKFIAVENKELTLRKMDIKNAEIRRTAEIESEKLKIDTLAESERQMEIAKGESEAQLIKARSEAEAIRIRAQAEAEAIKLKLLAEAEGTKALAEAIKSFNKEGIGVKIAEINADTQVKVAEQISKGIEKNSKLFLSSNSFYSDLISGINALKEADISLADITNGSTTKKSKPTKTTD